ncbi:MAG: T9SS type A sorting domain-containing protein [Bacteroidales bacterium]|nr:T9SS type A sorting domain-containing protein [Bacteroidales bacterium]MCF8345521.1 T9SS type A sorting domain-containing protein [Bacteroidales bacterium]MCF8352210.1 T9SS type A sorting domain-containing protein [Bacteroidales bacterium]MCF8377446.1 T9SS type A sorting domain-containing protein [Bacteroidales bacterium]MCF8401557.1 T9SS type A sorting domain-containing protein [Bacteroidales bacterium]
MMFTSESSTDSLSKELALLVDDGDTPGLESEVSTSFPYEAMEIRTELLNSSPYLSDTVMKTSVNKEDVLNNAMIRDVLVANPQSAKSVTIMNMLDERNDPMPQYMKDEIIQGKGILSPKDQLESRLAYQKLRQSKAHKFLSKAYLSDTSVVFLYDSLRNIAGNNIYNYYNLAFTELKQGDTLKSDALFDSIPVLFSLSYDQQDEFDNFEQLYDLRKMLKSNHKTVRQLDSTQTLMLMDLSGEPGIPGALAMNALIALDSISYNEPIHFPPNYKSISLNQNIGKDVIGNQRLNLYPNPAKNYITVDYFLHEDSEVEISGHIHIFDQNGKIIDELYCLKTRDQFVYSTEHIVSGVYYCCLIVNDDIWEVVKFIVSK